MSNDEGDPVAQAAEKGMLQMTYSQDLHERLGIWPSNIPGFDQAEGVIFFLDLDGREVVAPIQVVGSVDTDDDTWLWAWDNPSVFEPLKQTALHVRAFGEKHRSADLTTASLPCTYDEAWKFAAIAFELAGGFDVYSVPQDHGWIFVVVQEAPRPRAS